MAGPSPSVIACIESVERLQRALKKMELEAAAAKEKLHGAEEDLRAALESGTTGDWLRDECIKAWGMEPAVEAAYRHIHDSLSGRKGEFILLAYDFEKREPIRSLLNVERRSTARYYRLGILNDDKLALVMPVRWKKDGPMLGLPVAKFIEGEKEPLPAIKKLAVVEGGLFENFHQDRDPPFFTKYIWDKSGLSSGGTTPLAALRDPVGVELVVGNKAVKGWLASAAMADLYRPAAHALGMLELEPTDAA